MTEEKITKLKGRPMLHWVGKKPLEVVKNYPAQLVETFAAKDKQNCGFSFQELEKDWSNLILHGDNKEILSSLLVNGFRGKIDLIYIDPPFDSAADYVRKVELRGSSNKIEGEGQNILEQTQYTDIWANDNYLQFMYERLILLRELLSNEGSIYLHCDWHKSHHLRFLLDEVFGEGNFVNEIVWCYTGPSPAGNKFPRKHDNILRYSKLEKYIFNDEDIRVSYKANFTAVRGVHGRDYDKDLQQKRHEEGKIPEDWWVDISNVSSWRDELLSYPTQKPEALLERIIKASSNENSIILDCFAGSGTTAAVAQKLGRKWIATDINKGAIQTIAKRLQNVIGQQQQDLTKTNFCDNFKTYKVNNYDFQERYQATQIIIEKYGVERNQTDRFFDGKIGDDLVKMLDFSRPATLLDIQLIEDELQERPNETRNIQLFVSGAELAVKAKLEKHNKISPINKINLIDIQTDGTLIFEKAEAEIEIIKDKNFATIKIKNYISPTILKRLDLDRSLFGEHITNFKSQIDVVLIDANYQENLPFNITFSDVPLRKKDLINGEYRVEIAAGAKVAVKVIDMLGEEFFYCV